jgi:hypothetical protein
MGFHFAIACNMRKPAIRSLLLFAMALVSTTAVPATRNTHVVKDPHYGEVLFYFYQDKYFSALGHLMASREMNRFKHHDSESELLLGGLLLSYGVHDEAGRIFKRLIRQGASPDVRDRAWLYLAKIRFQRGYIAEAESALSRIQGNLPPDLVAEYRSLLALTLMKRGKYQSAVDILRPDSNGPGEGSAYARYNLGVALVKTGNTSSGKDMLNAVGTIQTRDKEMAALKDKANVALGYTELAAGNADQARAYLTRVRLKGPLSNKALLGMGWALTAQKHHNQALAPWKELQGRHALDPAVQESLLAVPYALARLESEKQAVTEYKKAIRVYEQEIARLDRAARSMQQGRLLDTLLKQPRATEQGWFRQMRWLPDVAETRYLMHLLAGNEFNEAYKIYLDLQYLDSNLKHWEQSIGSFDLMLANRKQRFYRRLPAIKRKIRQIDLHDVTRRHQSMRQQLGDIQRDGDALALASKKEQQLLARLHRIEQVLAGKPRTDENALLRERTARLKGLLLWQVSSDYQPRLWNLQRETRDLGRALDQANAGRETLAREEIETPRRFNQLAQRIQTQRPKIRTLRTQNRVLMNDLKQYLNTLAVAELRRQQQRLKTYIVQARYGILQIYDRADKVTEQEQ